MGLIAGVALGIKALADQPGGSYVTGRDGMYSDLVQQVDSAHAEAIAADVSFAVAAAAGITCAYFWFRPHGAAGGSTATVSAAPLQKGVAFLVGGTL